MPGYDWPIHCEIQTIVGAHGGVGHGAEGDHKQERQTCNQNQQTRQRDQGEERVPAQWHARVDLEGPAPTRETVEQHSEGHRDLQRRNEQNCGALQRIHSSTTAQPKWQNRRTHG